MVLAAERMGRTMPGSSLATRHLKGEPLHPTLAAGIEAEAASFHNQIRRDAALVTQANKHAEALKVEFGFQSAPQVAPSPKAARPRSMRP